VYVIGGCAGRRPIRKSRSGRARVSRPVFCPFLGAVDRGSLDAPRVGHAERYRGEDPALRKSAHLQKPVFLPDKLRNGEGQAYHPNVNFEEADHDDDHETGP